jgi:hypothetical protein
MLLRVIDAIVLHFDQADSHRRQITLLKKMMENVVASHELVRSFIPANYQLVCDYVSMPDEINVEEILQFSEAWLGETDMIGLDTVLTNKNRVLLMFDRALWDARKDIRSSLTPFQTNFFQNTVKLREKIAHASVPDELKRPISRLIKVADDAFLTHFFRQLISHCFLELKLVYFMQQMISRKDLDEKIISDKIRTLLSIPISNTQIKEFWNKLLLMYDSIAAEAGWCRIDIEPVSAARFSASSSSFFVDGGAGRVVVNSAENLLSTATAVAKSDSARVVFDSLKSIAGSASNSVSVAADSAKAIASSASDFIGTWWKKS